MRLKIRGGTADFMEEIAWVLQSDLRRNQIGFVKASKLKPQERYVLADDWD